MQQTYDPLVNTDGNSSWPAHQQCLTLMRQCLHRCRGTSAVPNTDATMFASVPMQLIPELTTHVLVTACKIHIFGSVPAQGQTRTWNNYGRRNTFPYIKLKSSIVQWQLSHATVRCEKHVRAHQNTSTDKRTTAVGLSSQWAVGLVHEWANP